jgi:hypothetical protein
MVYRGTGDTTAQAAFGVWITNRQYRAAIINCATTDIELRRTWSMAGTWCGARRPNRWWHR